MAINWRKLIVLLGCGILMSSLGACSKQVKQTESDARQTAPATSSTAAEPEAGDAHKGNNQAKSSDKNKLAAAAEKKTSKNAPVGSKSEAASSQTTAAKASDSASKAGSAKQNTRQVAKPTASNIKKAAFESAAYPSAGKGKSAVPKVTGKDSPVVSSLSQEARKKIVAEDTKAGLNSKAKAKATWSEKRDLTAQPGYEIYVKAVNCTESGRHKEAAKLYAQAAQMGLAEAQYEYSVCLANGTGVKASPSESTTKRKPIWEFTTDVVTE